MPYPTYAATGIAATGVTGISFASTGPTVIENKALVIINVSTKYNSYTTLYFFEVSCNYPTSLRSKIFETILPFMNYIKEGNLSVIYNTPKSLCEKLIGLSIEKNINSGNGYGVSDYKQIFNIDDAINWTGWDYIFYLTIYDDEDKDKSIINLRIFDVDIVSINEILEKVSIKYRGGDMVIRTDISSISRRKKVVSDSGIGIYPVNFSCANGIINSVQDISKKHLGGPDSLPSLVPNNNVVIPKEFSIINDIYAFSLTPTKMKGKLGDPLTPSIVGIYQ